MKNLKLLALFFLIVATSYTALAVSEIRGTVLGLETNSPIEAATVVVKSPAMGEKVAFTAADGTFRIGDLEAGVYNVVAKDASGAVAQENVTLEEGQNKEISLRVKVAEAKAESYTIEVTGSLLGATARDTPVPLYVIDQADVEKKGSPTMQEQIKTMPIVGPVFGDNNNFNQYYQIRTGGGSVNVRGIGDFRTLVLMNGKRFSVYRADTNLLPAAAIGRVEVLKDGGASTYGSDAIAGVVNYMTRKNFSGLDLNVDYRLVPGSSTGDPSASATYGWVGDNANVLLSFGYQHRGSLKALSRDWTTPAYTENPTGWSSLGNPGEWTILGPGSGGIVGFAQDANCAALGGFPGFSGNTPVCQYPYVPQYNLVNESDSFQGYGEFNTKIGDKSEFHLDALFSNTSTVQLYNASFPPIQGPKGPGYLNAYSVPAANPGFNDFLRQTNNAGLIGVATGAAATLWRPLAEGGFPAAEGRTNLDKNQELRVSSSLSGEVPGAPGMKYDLSATYVGDWSYFAVGDILSKRLQDALNGLGGPACNPATGTPGQGGCQWFNPFSNAIVANPDLGLTNLGFIPENANNVDLVKWLYDNALINTFSESKVFEGIVKGTVPVSLPGGEPKWAVGAQYRRNNYQVVLPNDNFNVKLTPCSDPNDRTCAVKIGAGTFLSPTSPLDIDQSVYSVYGQVDMPVFDRLFGSFGLRFEDYGEGTGSTLNPQFRGKLQTFDWFALRGSVGTSFRGPTAQDSSPTTITNLTGITATGNQFRAVDSTGNPNVGPEKALTFNVGGIFQAKNLTATMDYWFYKVDDQITLVPPNLIANAVAGPGTGAQLVNCSHPLAGLITFGGGCTQGVTTASTISRIRSDTVNGPSFTTMGLDGELDYLIEDVFGGSLNLGGSASFVITYDVADFTLNGQLLTPGYRADGFTNYDRLPGTISKWRGQFFTNYNLGSHNFRVTVTYNDGVTDNRGPTVVQTGLTGPVTANTVCNVANATAGTAPNCQLTTWGNTLSGFVPVDFTYRVALPYDFTLTATVFNIFNQTPPKARLELGYDPSVGNPLGTTIKAVLTKKF